MPLQLQLEAVRQPPHPPELSQHTWFIKLRQSFHTSKDLDWYAGFSRSALRSDFRVLPCNLPRIFPCVSAFRQGVLYLGLRLANLKDTEFSLDIIRGLKI